MPAKVPGQFYASPRTPYGCEAGYLAPRPAATLAVRPKAGRQEVNMDRYRAPYFDRLKAESVANYRDRKTEDDEGWKPWMRKAKRQPPEGKVCPTCHVKRGVRGGCFCE